MDPELYSPDWYVTTLKLNVPFTDSLLAWKRGTLLFGFGGGGMVGFGAVGMVAFVVVMVVAPSTTSWDTEMTEKKRISVPVFHLFQNQNE